MAGDSIGVIVAGATVFANTGGNVGNNVVTDGIGDISYGVVGYGVGDAVDGFVRYGVGDIGVGVGLVGSFYSYLAHHMGGDLKLCKGPFEIFP